MNCFRKTRRFRKILFPRPFEAIDEKRPELSNRHGVVFHQDNARFHVSLTTRQKLLQFDWDVLPHPPYSLDIASDFHLFRSLQNSLIEKISLLWKITKSTLKSFSPIKLRSSGRMEFSNCLKDGAKLKKTVNISLNKIIF